MIGERPIAIELLQMNWPQPRAMEPERSAIDSAPIANDCAPLAKLLKPMPTACVVLAVADCREPANLTLASDDMPNAEALTPPRGWDPTATESGCC